MLIASLNVNGVRAAVRRGLWEWVEETAPDVLCLQEVRAEPHEVPTPPAGYEAHWFPARERGYSGVGILTRLQVDSVEVGSGHEQFDAEGRVVTVRVRPRAGPHEVVTVVSAYVPSGARSSGRYGAKLQFLTELRAHVSRYVGNGEELVLAGDFNVARADEDVHHLTGNSSRPGCRRAERDGLNGMIAAGLRDTVRDLVGPTERVYTWWPTRNGARGSDLGWRLDYHLSTPGLHENAVHAEVPKAPALSDHAPVLVRYR